MNDKGVVPILLIMIGVVIIILALALTPVVRDFVDDSRATTTRDGNAGLDCSNTTISDYNKATCVASDLFTPTFFGILIAVAGTIMIAKILTEGT